MILPLFEIRYILRTGVAVVGLGYKARLALAFCAAVVVPALAINNCHNFRYAKAASPLEWHDTSIPGFHNG